jgi:hypothetical protein
VAAEAPKKSTLDKIGVAVDIADKLTGQLDKFDHQNVMMLEMFQWGQYLDLLKKRSVRLWRGSGMKVPINKISKINIIDNYGPSFKRTESW